jgi:hypothetical protein
MRVRPEAEADRVAVRALNEAAFETTGKRSVSIFM